MKTLRVLLVVTMLVSLITIGCTPRIENPVIEFMNKGYQVGINVGETVSRVSDTLSEWF